MLRVCSADQGEQDRTDLHRELSCLLLMGRLNQGLCTLLFRGQCVASVKTNDGHAFNSISF